MQKFYTKTFLYILGAIIIFEFLFFLHIGLNNYPITWNPIDNLTIWATVITIVFLVFSVMGLLNIDGRIKELNELKDKVAETYQQMQNELILLKNSSSEQKKEIVEKAEQEIKRLMDTSANRQNLYDIISKITNTPAPDIRVMSLTEFLQEHSQSEGVNYAYIYLQRGDAYQQMGKDEEALKDYEYAIKISPKEEAPYISLGCYYSYKKEYKKSIDYFTKATEINPKKASNWVNLANSYSALGEYEIAKNYYDRAMDITPNVASAYYNKAIYSKETKEDKTGELAKTFYKYCLKLNPLFYKARINLASLYRQENNILSARDEYDQIINLGFDETIVIAILQRGICNRLLGHIAAALIDFETVYHIAPHNVQNLSNLATTHFQLHHLLEAEQFIVLGQEEANKQNFHNCDKDFECIYAEIQRIKFINQYRYAIPIDFTKKKNTKDKNNT